MNVTEEQFIQYVTIQESGVTNMLNTATVDELGQYGGTPLSRETQKAIRNNYAELSRKYLNEVQK